MINQNVINFLIDLCRIDEANIPSILDTITSIRSNIKQYAKHSPASHLEILFSLHKLEESLTSTSPDRCEQLVTFLVKRWERIIDSDAQYLHDFENPINELCISIAQLLNNQHYLAFLMPTLLNDQVLYLTSGYDEAGVDLKEVILSDDNSALIHIGDVLDFCQLDGTLKHNSLLNGKQRTLSKGEATRLLTRDTAVADYYLSLSARVRYRLNGDTVGAALNRLIDGLCQGGRRFDGEEYNAGEAANIAIIEFFDFFALLPEDVQQQVRKTYIEDENTEEDVISLGKLFQYLSHQDTLVKYERDMGLESEWRMNSMDVSLEEYIEENAAVEGHAEEEESEEDDELSVAFCVELIANDIERVLKEHPELYEISPQTDFVKQSLEQLDDNIRINREQYQIAIQTLCKHPAYKKKEFDLNALIEEISVSPNFKMISEQVYFIINKLFLNKPLGEDKSAVTRAFFAHLIQNYNEQFLKTVFSRLTKTTKIFFNAQSGLDFDPDDNYTPYFLRPRKTRIPRPLDEVDNDLDAGTMRDDIFRHGR